MMMMMKLVMIDDDDDNDEYDDVVIDGHAAELSHWVVRYMCQLRSPTA